MPCKAGGRLRDRLFEGRGRKQYLQDKSALLTDMPAERGGREKEMILVDIQSPVMDQVYEFELDEEARAEEILKEIVLLIGQKEKVSLKEEEGMQLYALRRESLLDKERTLKEQGVEAGDRLFLI